MKILIDTNVFLWMTTSPEKIPDRIFEALVDDKSKLFFSAASAWEISIKYAKKKLSLPEHPRSFIEKSLLASDIIPLAIRYQDTTSVSDLPYHHPDPFDRLLVTRAMDMGLSLMSADKKLEKYDVDLILVKPRR
jgi:PIN domain nuclease of toxin-antitoxin system